MELKPQEQIEKIIEKSKEILLIADLKDGVDSLSSLLAFHLALKKLNKKSNPVVSSVPPKSLAFLPAFDLLKKDLKGAKDFIISLDIRKTKVDQFRYNVKGDKLNIYITPKGGYFEPHDVETKKGKSKFDLIIALNTPSLENLNELYQENAEIFYESPIINIDCHSTNENFGEINLVEMTASSTAEILFGLFQRLGDKLIDQSIATCLLTGIISKTNSFQTHNTTPNTFAAAAKLVNLEAKRETIIQNLYKTRSLASLRLWGRALARLKTALHGKVVWSLLSQLDFEKSDSTVLDTEQILDELKNNTLTPDLLFIAAQENPNLIHLRIKKVNKNIDLTKLKNLLLAKGFKEEETREDLISLTKSESNLNLLEKEALAAIKKVLPT